jgi:hypothetical protein
MYAIKKGFNLIKEDERYRIDHDLLRVCMHRVHEAVLLATNLVLENS